ncbi:MAG: methylaspartate ammonia-lyase [Spirochaetota bacterium]
MKIVKALFSGGNSGFFFDDQRAIKAGAGQDGFFYTGKAHTPGFDTVRQAGEAVSVMLLLEDGSLAEGDCAAVQYSGAGGRDPLFLAESYLQMLRTEIAPLLEGREAEDFRENATFVDQLENDGKQLHTAIRYGLSQALLDAAALAGKESKTEVVCRQWNLPLTPAPVPLFGQSGDERYAAVDKMILKQVDALPHGLINNVDEKLGRRGEKLAEYVAWLKERIAAFWPGQNGARELPDLHIDVYGTIGIAFENKVGAMADYLARLGEIAAPHRLYIEGPVDLGEREAQIRGLAELKQALERKGSEVKIVADEWCNTLQDIQDFADARCCHMAQIKTPDLGSIHNVVDSVLYCKQNGIEAYQGGTCNETDLSARTCVHLALAARPERMLVKPGMGFDEGLVIVRNEMMRTIELLNYRHGISGHRPGRQQS